MNKIFYKNAFFDEASKPDGAVEISQELWNDLLSGQSEDRIITPDENGYPVLAERVKDLDYYKRKASILIEEGRKEILDFYEEGVPIPENIKNFRRQLREIMEMTQLPEGFAFPEREKKV